jgi:hypothetical protein
VTPATVVAEPGSLKKENVAARYADQGDGRDDREEPRGR